MIEKVMGLNPVELLAGAEMYDEKLKKEISAHMSKADEKVFNGGIVVDENGNESFLDMSKLEQVSISFGTDCIEGAWMVKPIKSEVTKLASKMGLDIADLSAFDSIIKWKRNPDIQRPPKVDDEDDEEKAGS